MSVVLINPGSHVEGGMEDQARINAFEWLHRMREHGITDVVIDNAEPPAYSSGRWTFIFRHTLTGRTAELCIHGLTPTEVQERTFGARVYWNGSSCSDPTWEDFLAPRFEVGIRPVQS